VALESGRYMETVGKNTGSHSIFPADSYCRVVEYVFLTDPFIHPRFLKSYIGANLDDKGRNKNLTFSRRYLDPNRVTYEVAFFHLRKSESNLNVRIVPYLKE